MTPSCHRHSTAVLTVLCAAAAASGQFVNHTLPSTLHNRTVAAMAIGGCGPTTKLKRFSASTLCVQLGDQVAAFDVTVDAMHGIVMLGSECHQLQAAATHCSHST